MKWVRAILGFGLLCFAPVASAQTQPLVKILKLVRGTNTPRILRVGGPCLGVACPTQVLISDVEAAVRFRNLPISPTLAINERAAAIEAGGGTVYRWGFGESPFNPPSKMIDELARAAAMHRYAPNQGLPELRDAISEFHVKHFGIELPAEHIIVFPGTKSGLDHITRLIDADAILIPAPHWVSYSPQARFADKDVFSIVTELANDYKLQPHELRAAARVSDGARGKMLILTSPNNPTGGVYSAAEMEALTDVAREEGITILYDGIYAHPTDFAGNATATPMQFYPEGTIYSSGLSKVYSAGGWRLGYLAFPSSMAKLARDMRSLISDTIGSVATPIQAAAIAAYKSDPTVLFEITQAQRLHAAVGHYLHRRFTAMGLAVPEAQGAFYLYPDFEAYRGALAKSFDVHDSSDLTRVLFDNTRIATLPAASFGDDPTHLAIRVATGDFDGPAVYAASLKAGALDDAFVEHHMPRIKEGADQLESFLRGMQPQR